MPCGRTGDKCVITFSPDGKQVLRSCDVLLADGHSKFITELFDAATGHRLWAIYETRSYIEPHINKFSGDGTRLANGRGHAVNIRDAATGTCLSKVTIPSTGIWALSSDGTKLATIPCRYFHNPTQHPPHLHRIRISDIATGSYRCLENMFDSYYCSSITFSPDDGYIVLMSNNYLFPNNYTCIVHAATGALLKRLVGFECSGLRIAGLQTSHGIYDTQALLDDPRGRIEYNSNDILEGTLSGIGITSERDWITKNGKPFLWIPPEDRRIHSLDQYNRNIAIAGNTIAFYYPTGQIYCIRLCSSSAGCNRPVYSSVNEFNTFLLSPTTRQT
ncbi:hypothetical protein RRF57_001809 [Xylaria bambusicola]|uniref:Uncharacterized protein n=1 Tax=Xylaria bambusicola TaxID=326684 RepID=A0AAN7UC37_9PEZI